MIFEIKLDSLSERVFFLHQTGERSFDFLHKSRTENIQFFTLFKIKVQNNMSFMKTCPQDLEVRYTEGIAKYIWLENVCCGCFCLPLDKSLDSVFGSVTVDYYTFLSPSSHADCAQAL